ncbi:alginate export family protein [uncultured Thiodictyon sp.]|uniref:alginate export family protein n=1 Tax=uncultured Thiodictyon sp. TaxID=1846217 RepID=UPI0025F7627F|nr:alginate export family protein [uncultured Thiodictyon sp.]
MNSKQIKVVVAVALTYGFGLFGSGPVAADQTFGPATLGADGRLREIYIGNVGLNTQSPSGNRSFQRYRLRAWGEYKVGERFGVAARLLWEGRHYALPLKSTWAAPGFQTWWNGDVLFDKLTLDFKKIGGLPLTLKAGRQDVMLGNGWLVMDGTPLDGSRTLYMDAARVTCAVDSIKTTFDLLYINNSPNTARFPTPLGGGTEDQTEQFETGGILYARNKSLLKDTDLDAYYIYKHNNPNDTVGNLRNASGAPFASPADAGEVNALGVRIDSKLTPAWAVRAEAAGEWGGTKPYPGAPRQDLAAFGFNGRLTYAFNDKRANRLHLDLEYLSGDDPHTKANESFDPLWGRWPQWSELMIYQWPLDSRVGQATNLTRLNLGWLAKVHPTTEVLLDYHALWANQQSTRSPAQLVNISQNGNFRGHLFTGWVKTKFNAHVSGHLVAEYLAPGAFYAANRRDGSYFLRAEVVLAF